MKIASVLLRWYKSFNINYMGYPEDRIPDKIFRPWNDNKKLNPLTGKYPFIEIPLEKDVTTIVGGNESGKSHLLSAISKVLTGKGIPDAYCSEGSVFSRTDLCHYTAQRSINATDWPNIGLVFDELSDEESESIAQITSAAFPTKDAKDRHFAIVLAPTGTDLQAFFFWGKDSMAMLDRSKLDKIRKLLPRVEFIKSDLAMCDQFVINDLIKSYNNNSGGSADSTYGHAEASKFLNYCDQLNFKDANSISISDPKKFFEHYSDFRKSKLNSEKCDLELLLFRDVLGISLDALEYVANLGINVRTHADSLVNLWNNEIDNQLNLSHYWRQDDSFKLRINYKHGILYFEITDRTGVTYCFKERSSGLRYFLSYYIQAKAIERSAKGSNAIILMDEPDSFLSIVGQKNLLSIFESLVGSDLSNQKCQLVYTTHSPFLINRNFPFRLRLVRKGDVEEGTQVVDKAMLRRYEPVRSALGIDCAQTLFMGATNLVVEGPSDQFVLCELVRYFAHQDTISDYLDLNSITVLSAENASGIEKLLSASQWGNEPIPATVVLLDSDPAGETAKLKITGAFKPQKGNSAKTSQRLIEDAYVLSIGQLIKSDSSKIISTEDIIPPAMYISAVKEYLKRWMPEEWERYKAEANACFSKSDLGKNGIVDDMDELIREITGGARSLDKFGIFQELIDLLTQVDSSEEKILQNDDILILQERVKAICFEVRKAISGSQQAARTLSGKQSITRFCRDFSIQHPYACGVYELHLFLARLQNEVEILGIDGDLFAASIKRLLTHVHSIRKANQSELRDVEWQCWLKEIERIKHNPLMYEVYLSSEGNFLEKPETGVTTP